MSTSCGVYGAFEKCTLIKETIKENTEDRFPTTEHSCVPEFTEAMRKCDRVCTKVDVFSSHPMATFNQCAKWTEWKDLNLKIVTKEN